jgi:hypothetical protein
MGVSPWLLGGVICALLCVTTMQYFFAPPMKNVALLGGGAYEEEGLAFWGAVDAEFDWCESNYEHQILGVPVAEMVNTATSLLYFLPPIYVLCCAPDRASWTFSGRLNFVLVGLIAVTFRALRCVHGLNMLCTLTSRSGIRWVRRAFI